MQMYDINIGEKKSVCGVCVVCARVHTCVCVCVCVYVRVCVCMCEREMACVRVLNFHAHTGAHIHAFGQQ